MTSSDFRSKLNGTPGVSTTVSSGSSGNEGEGPSGLSSRVQVATGGVAVGNGIARSASPPGFPDMVSGGVSASGGGGGSVSGGGAFDIHDAGGGSVGGRGSDNRQPLHQQHLNSTSQNRQSTEGFGGRGAGGGGGSDLVASMGALSLGGGGMGAGNNKGMSPYGGGMGGGRLDPYSNHVMDPSRLV